jgi:hypothetical protein
MTRHAEPHADPLSAAGDVRVASIERWRALLEVKPLPLSQALEAARELEDIITAARAEIEKFAEPADEIVVATPAAETAKRLREDADRVAVAQGVIRIAEPVLRAIQLRRDEAREAERAAAIAAEYDATEKLVTAVQGRFEEFLGRFAPQARELLAEAATAQQKVVAVNRNLPDGVPPIRSLEQRRTGEPHTRQTVVRQFGVFFRGNDRIGDVGKCASKSNGDGTFSVFVHSNSIQGGQGFGGCRIVEFVEVRIEKLQSRAENLATALRIPEFHAPYVSAGVERRTMTLAAWEALAAPVQAIAAE